MPEKYQTGGGEERRNFDNFDGVFEQCFLKIRKESEDRTAEAFPDTVIFKQRLKSRFTEVLKGTDSFQIWGRESRSGAKTKFLFKLQEITPRHFRPPVSRGKDE